MFFNKILNHCIRFSLPQLTKKTFSTIPNLVIRSTITTPAIVPATLFQSILGNSFLKPINFVYNQVAGFKVKGKLRKRCKDCFFVMREERLFVLCKTHPRHKQMAMKAKPKKSWILTHATQSKIRPY